MKLIACILLFVLVSGCTPNHPETVVTDQPSTPVPAEVELAIQKEYPGALHYKAAIDSLIARLARAGVSSEHMLWGQSTCVDDITNTKNKIVHPEIKGPFTFGGLGGLPFTGVTGIEAFAHHVPQNGTAMLFLGPHIGYRAGDGWGKILRHEQDHPSTCCGALCAALDKLKAGEIKAASPSEEDYQEEVIEQLALRHKDEILSANVPLTEFTHIIYQEAEAEMFKYVAKVKDRDFAYGVVVVGVIINTDFEYDDYLWIHHIAVRDIKNDRWLEGI